MTVEARESQTAAGRFKFRAQRAILSEIQIGDGSIETRFALWRN